MTVLYTDSPAGDDERRAQLYGGALHVFSASPGTRALIEVARTMCEEAFAPHHPTEAQHHMSVEAFNDVLKTLKPAFIHDPRCKDAIRQILLERGCDAERTFFDVPRLRTATSDDYLTSGLAYAFKPHRDTWYSTPRCQLNWWLPVYEVEPGNCMAFHTDYWNEPLANSSHEFDYQDWNEGGRKAAHNQGTKDTRRQSEATEEVRLDPQLRIVPEPGGMIVFSAAHLHSTVPNDTGRTRISIDFRTVHMDELEANGGAPNPDSACSGTTIGDYRRTSDLAPVPEEMQAAYRRLETSMAPIAPSQTDLSDRNMAAEREPLA